MLLSRRLLLVILLLAPLTAYSHAHLRDAAPADGARLDASPSEINLRYSEAIEPRFSSFRLYRVSSDGEGDKSISLGSPDAHEGNTVIRLPVAESLARGDYELRWEVLAADGHTTRGTVSFAVSGD